jgi:GNAT superfamily N-acetyltransferase
MYICYRKMEAQMPAFQTATNSETFRPRVSIRHYRAEDRDHVFHLLSFLPDLYPRSFDWLERRLIDVERKQAYCMIGFLNCSVAGILIDTPKGIRTSKISTFFVKEQAHRKGLGTLLLEASARRWRIRGVDDVYVTVASQKRRSIDAFLRSNGFLKTAELCERYGPNRSELVYSLKLN